MTKIYCPCCRTPEADISLSIVDGDTFTCNECNEEFSTQDIRDMLASVESWKLMLAWVEKCPSRVVTE